MTNRITLLYLGKKGGIAQCAVALARSLARNADVTCIFSAFSALRPKMEALPCPVRFLPTYHGAVSFALRTLAWRPVTRIAGAILDTRPDLVLDAGSPIWGDLVGRILGQRVLRATVVHDPVLHSERITPLLNLQRRLLPCDAPVLIAMSGFAARLLRCSHPGATVIASRLGIIHGSARPDPRAVANRRSRFLFFGRIEPYKGVGILLEAFGLAKAIIPEIELDVVGSGKMSAAEQRLARRAGVRVRNEYVADAVVEEYCRNAGCVVLPYLEATQSAVAATAMAWGLPAIASDVGALPEQVAHGINGLIVPPGEAKALCSAMIRLAESETLSQSLSEGAIARAESDYAWDDIGEELNRNLTLFLAGHMPPDRRSEVTTACQA